MQVRSRFERTIRLLFNAKILKFYKHIDLELTPRSIVQIKEQKQIDLK